MIRFYLCDVVGAGTRASPFRPVFRDLIPSGVTWMALDDRDDEKVAAGRMLVRADTTLAQHNLLIADARVTHIALRSALAVRIRNRLHPSWELA